ncbi:MerR family transcriptional regulator [Leuconostoc carnosum]|uniref:MerR family transcriptional regulator n=1 Tax=Leuconostoc carnosum TaxID=1252 RepID=UPI00345C752F
MFLKDFLIKTGTNRDTIRYYIQQQLLDPEKIQGKYYFTTQEFQDYQDIMALKEMGFSIKSIQSIKKWHDNNCGTKEQWEHNLQIIDEEIAHIEKEIYILENRKQRLVQVKEQLKVLISSKTAS